METEEKERKTQWHKVFAMVLKPFFNKLGYELEPEVDVSFKSQMIDVVVVKKKEIAVDRTNLPIAYWEAFNELNEHNLISFKSYSESFNEYFNMELYSHLINYSKNNKNIPIKKINLYAVVYHRPNKLFKDLKEISYLKEIKKGEIYDVDTGAARRIRFILTQKTDNPLLSLFSGDPEKIINSYKKIERDTDFLKDIRHPSF